MASLDVTKKQIKWLNYVLEQVLVIKKREEKKNLLINEFEFINFNRFVFPGK